MKDRIVARYYSALVWICAGALVLSAVAHVLGLLGVDPPFLDPYDLSAALFIGAFSIFLLVFVSAAYHWRFHLDRFAELEPAAVPKALRYLLYGAILYAFVFLGFAADAPRPYGDLRDQGAFGLVWFSFLVFAAYQAGRPPLGPPHDPHPMRIRPFTIIVLSGGILIILFLFLFRRPTL